MYMYERLRKLGFVCTWLINLKFPNYIKKIIIGYE